MNQRIGLKGIIQTHFCKVVAAANGDCAIASDDAEI